MLERLDGGELKKVQQFINGLNATNKKKIPSPPKCEKTTLHNDLSQEAITPSNLLSVGLQCKEEVVIGNSCTASCMLSCRHGDEVVVIGEEGHSGTLRDT